MKITPAFAVLFATLAFSQSKGQTPGTLKGNFLAKLDQSSALADSPYLYARRMGTGACMVRDVDGDGLPEIMAVSIDRDGNTLLHQIRVDKNGQPKRGHIYTNINSLIATGTISGTSLPEFGVASMDNMGDLNGDGTDDIAIGNPSGGSIAYTGEFYLAYLNRLGKIDSIRQFRNQNWAMDTTMVAGGFFGTGIKNIGDIDGDGVSDIISGQPNTNTVWIIFMTRQGLVKRRTRIYSGSQNFATLPPLDYFGTASCGVGDLDGDGIRDVMTTSRDTSYRGALWTLFLNADGSVKSYKRLNPGTPSHPDTVAKQTLYGNSITSIGDIDGDSVTDVAVGEPVYKDVGVQGFGRVHILFMNRDGSIKAKQVIDRNSSRLVDSAMMLNRGFGWHVFPLGDFDGDGVTDLGTTFPNGTYQVPYGSGTTNSSGLCYILLLNGVPVKTGTGDLIENNAASFFAYPNPASDQLIIRRKKHSSAPITVTILDMGGRMVERAETVDGIIHLNVKDWKSGNYLISLFSEGAQQTIKFTKQ